MWNYCSGASCWIMHIARLLCASPKVYSCKLLGREPAWSQLRLASHTTVHHRTKTPRKFLHMVVRRPRAGAIVCFWCDVQLSSFLPLRRRLPPFAAPNVQRRNVQHGSAARAQSPSFRAAALSRGPKSPRHIHSSSASTEPRAVDEPQDDAAAANTDSPDSAAADEPAEQSTVEAQPEGTSWASLLDEVGEPTEEDIFGYIDEIRPPHDTILAKSDFDKRAVALAEGFTTSQLVAYISKNIKEVVMPTEYGWEVRRQPWVPVVEDTASGGGKAKKAGLDVTPNVLLKGYVNRSMTAKEKAVVQLMRSCWGVSLREKMEALGEIRVAVRTAEFALLKDGAQTWLRDISDRFLKNVGALPATQVEDNTPGGKKAPPHPRIELLPQQQVLRVVTPASVALTVIAEIDKILSRTVTKRVPLAALPELKAAMPSEVLEALGALTGSYVRLSEPEGEHGADAEGQTVPGDGSDTDLLTSWIMPTGQNPSLEDTGDVVFRTLLDTFGPWRAAQAKSAVDLSHTTEKDKLVLEMDDRNQGSWRWTRREGMWARLFGAAFSNPRSTHTGGSVPAKETLPYPVQWPVQSQESPEHAVQTSTVATFGRVLYRKPDGTKAPLVASESFSPASLSGAEHVFSPKVPPIVGLDHAPDVDSATGAPVPPRISTSVHLRFVPDPAAADARQARPLGAVVDIVPSQAFSLGRAVLRELHAVVQTHTCDVLFPAQPVDARITQTRFVPLLAAGPSADKPGPVATDPDWRTWQSDTGPLIEFLRDSHVSHGAVAGEPVLNTPAWLRNLRLPVTALWPADSHKKSTSRANVVKGQETTAPIDYLLAGLEVRRTVATALEGWTLAMTSVNTVQGGSRWMEMSLEAVPFAAGGLADVLASNHSRSAFREAVGLVVRGERVLWTLPHGRI